jgi:hypothetical protein
MCENKGKPPKQEMYDLMTNYTTHHVFWLLKTSELCVASIDRQINIYSTNGSKERLYGFAHGAGKSFDASQGTCMMTVLQRLFGFGIDGRERKKTDLYRTSTSMAAWLFCKSAVVVTL